MLLLKFILGNYFNKLFSPFFYEWAKVQKNVLSESDIMLIAIIINYLSSLFDNSIFTLLFV